MKIFFTYCLASLLLIGTALTTPLPDGYIVPKETVSPSHRYGFMVPIFSILSDANDVHNALVDLKTGRVVAEIDAPPGFDHRLNHVKILPPWWSKDESLVLWTVAGKWCPTALVLIHFRNGVQVWQLNLLTTFQKEILISTKAVAPEKYEEAKQENAGSGTNHPEGFTIDVKPMIKSVASNKRPPLQLPLKIHVTLTSNPKQLDCIPDLDATMTGVVKKDGSIEVKQFSVCSKK